MDTNRPGLAFEAIPLQIMQPLTCAASVIRLDVCLADLAILHLEGISLATHTTEDGVRLETEVQGLGKLTGWVTKESDLMTS